MGIIRAYSDYSNSHKTHPNAKAPRAERDGERRRAAGCALLRDELKDPLGIRDIQSSDELGVGSRMQPFQYLKGRRSFELGESSSFRVHCSDDPPMLDIHQWSCF